MKPEPEFVMKFVFDSVHMAKKAVHYKEVQEKGVRLHVDLTALPFSTTVAIIV